MGIKIVFLDIDGVLNNDPDLWALRERQLNGLKREDRDDIFAKHVQLLNDLIDRSGAKVVLSSTWRMIFTLADMRGMLNHHGFKGDLIDKTPHHAEGPKGRCERGDEIAWWLNFYDRETVDSFVILDDNSDMGDLHSNFVQTDAMLGLTQEDVERALAILNPCHGRDRHPDFLCDMC